MITPKLYPVVLCQQFYKTLEQLLSSFVSLGELLSQHAIFYFLENLLCYCLRKVLARKALLFFF